MLLAGEENFLELRKWFCMQLWGAFLGVESCERIWNWRWSGETFWMHREFAGGREERSAAVEVM